MTETIHQTVVQSYAKQAHKYDRRFKNYLEGTLSVALDFMKLTGSEKILDVACGTGELEIRIFKQFPNQSIVGVDVSEDMLRQAAEKIGVQKNLILKAADSRELPFNDNQFDIVVTCSAFHYMREPEKVLKEFARVLKPGGRVILLDWCRDFLNGKIYHYFRKIFFPAHYDVYGLEQMKEMMRAAGLNPIAEKTFKVETIWRMMCVEARKS